MRFNKMTSYGIRVVARLLMEEGKVMTSTALATKEGIPPGVLMKVLSKLRMAGIVESHQGRGQVAGGFSLKNNCKNINMKELLEVLEGEMELYPICEEEKYMDEYKKLYERMKTLNEEYVGVLSMCKVKDML